MSAPRARPRAGVRTPAGPARVVLDTHVVLSALVFARRRLAPLRLAWQAQRLAPPVSTPTAQELVRVLAYPKFKLGAAGDADALATGDADLLALAGQATHETMSPATFLERLGAWAAEGKSLMSRELPER